MLPNEVSVCCFRAMVKAVAAESRTLIAKLRIGGERGEVYVSCLQIRDHGSAEGILGENGLVEYEGCRCGRSEVMCSEGRDYRLDCPRL